MNYWMTEERRQIARKNVHDMVNSFVEDPYGANYHEGYNPPYMTIYSPDIERLLEKACFEDKYNKKHPDLAELYCLDPDIYDIEGHRVHTLSGNIDIVVDGVAFDQNEYFWLHKYDEGKKRNKFFSLSLPQVFPNKGESATPRGSEASHKYHVRLPTK